MENYAAKKRNEECIHILPYLRIYNYMKKQGGVNSIWNATIYLINNINYASNLNVCRGRGDRVEEMETILFIKVYFL